MTSSSIETENAHLTLQSEFMANLARTPGGCLQSDSVHGFVHCPPVDDVNVTFTSRFCTVLQRTVPVLISFMLGKSQEHYKMHFAALFRSMRLDTKEQFEAEFPGMTCDFSDAERCGFRLALGNHLNLSDDQDIQMEKHYHFCRVHLIRSLDRIARNGAIIDPDQRDVFYDTVMSVMQVLYHSHMFSLPLYKELSSY
ncbi:hypothetical protein B0O80DRAFT_500822 [Mortierella sp. GBAus27b]|nr:hypothetical protein B0O80DRAFT_500822 [Mortierella sp. GBAus27b]